MTGVAEVNKAYFNDEAATYDQKHGKTLDQLLQVVRDRLDFIGAGWIVSDDSDEDDEEGENEGGSVPGPGPARTLRFLDYACGTGVLSRALAPYVTQCVGVDISENMVAAYNARARNQGLAEDEMHAVQGNLVDPADPDPAGLRAAQFWNLDVAAVGLGFHHFDDPDLAAARLAARLRPGGVLFILDFLPHEAGEFDSAHTVRHHGFSEEDIRAVFSRAGVGKDFGLQTVGPVHMPAREPGGVRKQRALFIARGTKG